MHHPLQREIVEIHNIYILYIYYIYIIYIIYIYIYIFIVRRLFFRLVLATAVFKKNFEMSIFLQNEMTSNGFLKIMKKFSFICDASETELVKLDIKK